MPKQPNMNQMMKQVQQMQAEMVKAQEELGSEVLEASAGGGMVTVKITGALEVREIAIDPVAVDPEDVGGSSRTWCSRRRTRRSAPRRSGPRRR